MTFVTYPRHRWTGADLSVDQVALAESIHGLASASWLHMVHQGGLRKGGGSGPASSTAASSSLGMESRVLLMLMQFWQKL
eukprot:626115-Prorocentrum_lima.AAC.1